jgi:hypothetical protein
VKLIRKIEERIAGGLIGASRNVTKESGDCDPTELKPDILDAVEYQVRTLGHNRAQFPFPQITITLAADSAARQALLDTAFQQEFRLEKLIRRRLLKLGCPPPVNLVVKICYVPAADAALGGRPFSIDFAPPDPRAAPLGRAGSLVVLNGRSSGPEVFEMMTPRVNIGRLADILNKGAIVRSNDLVFPNDLHPANVSVSRVHAHIEFDSTTGDFRVFDDASRTGTRVVRGNRTLPVPASRTAGVELRDGDEIYFGAVCVRLRMRT